MNSVYNVEVVNHELAMMEIYLDVLIDSLADYKEKLINISDFDDLSQIRPLGKLTDDDEKIYRYNDFGDSIVGGEIHFKFFQSFIVNLYSIIEKQLINLCSSLDIRLSVGIDDRDTLGTGIFRARKFLQDGIHYDIDESHWSELYKVNKIRNQIVHFGGEFVYYDEKPDDGRNYLKIKKSEDVLVYLNLDKDLYNYMGKYSICGFYGAFLINPNEDYCYHLLDFCRGFFNKLFSYFNLLDQ